MKEAPTLQPEEIRDDTFIMPLVTPGGETRVFQADTDHQFKICFMLFREILRINSRGHFKMYLNLKQVTGMNLNIT